MLGNTKIILYVVRKEFANWQPKKKDTVVPKPALRKRSKSLSAIHSNVSSDASSKSNRLVNRTKSTIQRPHKNIQPIAGQSGSSLVNYGTPPKSNRLASRSKSIAGPYERVAEHKTPRSILKTPNRLRNRSKSVSLDRRVVLSASPSPPSHVGRSGFASPMVAPPPNSMLQSNETFDPNGNSAFAGTSNESLSFDDRSNFQARIDGLVDSNRAKINRIIALTAEKSAFLVEIDALHNINKSLAETVDMYNADDDAEGRTRLQTRWTKSKREDSSSPHFTFEQRKFWLAHGK